ncbi:MAG TPA: hypothetical protein VES60_10890 [Nakamurella sp.]|nr:hypothetical protein [Nakamurella sp.]
MASSTGLAVRALHYYDQIGLPAGVGPGRGTSPQVLARTSDAHYANSRAEGAVILCEPQDMPDGVREYSARGLGGRPVVVFMTRLD